MNGRMNDSVLSVEDADISVSPDFAQEGCQISPKAKDWARILKKSDVFENKNTFINDSVHGHIQVPSICRAVIDTPQFDRLRGIRQLGTAHYVYPCAKHTRWEHSVGVMHLAGEFISVLRHPDRNQIDCCDEKDKHCVMLAGLCHDLGHGPYSHLWEHFVAEARPGHQWLHEKSSIDMLDFLIQDNDLMPVFEKYGFNHQDIIFIKELIYGPLGEKGEYVGRGPEKQFLYEIVANKISSIDVDKWDYFLRDNLAMNIGLTFDYRRFMFMSYVKEIDGKLRLALAEKEARSVQKMFEDRARLHEQGYQHRVIKKTDRMITDILLAADEHLELAYNQKGEPVRLSAACDDMFAFAQLSDDLVYNIIKISRGPELQRARDIIHRLATRNLYPIIGSIQCRGESVSGKLDEYAESLEERIREEGVNLGPSDLVISFKKITSGLGRKNPVERVLFVDSRGKCVNYNTKYMKPNNIEEETILVMLRKEGEVDEAVRILQSWGNQHFSDDTFYFSCMGRE